MEEGEWGGDRLDRVERGFNPGMGSSRGGGGVGLPDGVGGGRTPVSTKNDWDRFTLLAMLCGSDLDFACMSVHY